MKARIKLILRGCGVDKLGIRPDKANIYPIPVSFFSSLSVCRPSRLAH
jgi:hypothetical protein